MGYYMAGDYYAAGGPLLSRGLSLGRIGKLAKSPVGKKLGGKLIKVGGRILRRKAGVRAPGLGGHHRRMHPTNVRALRRALRRIKGFERVARHVLAVTHGKQVHTRFKMHHKRKG